MKKNCTRRKRAHAGIYSQGESRATRGGGTESYIVEYFAMIELFRPYRPGHLDKMHELSLDWVG